MSHTMTVEYVIRNNKGEEVARFQDLAEARRYDRVLTAAEQLFELFRDIPALSGVDDAVMDEVSFQIARRSGEVIPILSRIGREKTAGGRSEKQAPEREAESREAPAASGTPERGNAAPAAADAPEPGESGRGKVRGSRSKAA